ncbi:restriction endonuclease subunit S [Burkholderia pseudomallei]|uniref:restriction endonuclease subunit S n=1 Tax=Burkholderia pseudomallei TaxID=28450 RepID=UPI000F079549|nr:restriction endonuclease subunit S [Burkholderia pseudomallei]VBO96105.1 type I restriction enzyme specificity protein [Burkholderia pseudomallei]VBP04945.1 type I restriction enzyme specificity protein [Burkholderia pseudomallei]
MSLPTYREYQDSGVAWLGRVPATWSLAKLKHVARFSGGGTPNRENADYWGGDIPWVSPKDMKTEEISGSEERITEAGLEGSATSLVPPGRVLMVVRSGILKHTIPVAINRVDVALNQDMKALDFDQVKCNGKFFLRWTQGLNGQLLLAWAKQGATVESIEHQYLAETIIPLPPLSEQTTIVDFLDHEVGKIDALIAEQETLLTLLAEKRQATISHAVTRGLNPDARMKDSGMAWLGEVPAHWGVKKVGYDCNVLSGFAFPSAGFSLDDADVKLLRGVNVGVGTLRWSDVVYWNRVANDGLEAFELRPGDIVLGMDRPWISEGLRVARVSENDTPSLLLQRVATIRPNSKLNADYLYHLFRAGYFFHHCAPEMTGVSVPHISPEQIRSFVVPVPPVDEQSDIAAFIEAECMKLDALDVEGRHSIDLLKERRSALIAAAVTGKIDVRNALPAELAA